MEAISHSWIEANVEVVGNYLQQEFENFAIAHRVDQSLTHAFIVHDGKKLFILFIEWPILADRSFAQAGFGHLLNEHVAGKMRLHGADGYHWEPSHETTTMIDDI